MTSATEALRTSRALARTMSEVELQNDVIELARRSGWLVHHARPARNVSGWCTPIQGDRGFPDLVLAKNGCVLFAELKSESGRVRPEQRGWIKALDGEREGALLPDQRRVLRSIDDGGWLAIVVWAPGDWLSGEIEQVLTGGVSQRSS